MTATTEISRHRLESLEHQADAAWSTLARLPLHTPLVIDLLLKTTAEQLKLKHGTGSGLTEEDQSEYDILSGYSNLWSVSGINIAFSWLHLKRGRYEAFLREHTDGGPKDPQTKKKIEEADDRFRTIDDLDVVLGGRRDKFLTLAKEILASVEEHIQRPKSAVWFEAKIVDACRKMVETDAFPNPKKYYPCIEVAKVEKDGQVRGIVVVTPAGRLCELTKTNSNTPITIDSFDKARALKPEAYGVYGHKALSALVNSIEPF